MPEFKFFNATQDDKGVPARRRGWIQEVNTHSAILGHARRRVSPAIAPSSDLKQPSRRSPKSRVQITVPEIDESAPLETALTVPDAPVNEQSRVSLEEVAPQTFYLREITSSLGPFLRLPADCSDHEKALLSFHLQHGRRKMLGTSANPKYDIALDACQQQIQSNPIWSWVHIVLAEEVLSKITHRAKTPNFYRRRASAYADTKKLLLDDDVSIPAKLATLVMLQVMESHTGNWKLQAMHSDAIDQLVVASGGLTLFLKKNKGENDMVQPIWFLSIWRAGLFKLLPQNEFEEASSSLCSFFHEVRGWMISVSKSGTDQGQRQCNMVALAQLIKYLDDLISTNLNLEEEGSSVTFQGLASFALILHLCGTFTRLNCDLSMTTKFLLCFQGYLKDSFSDPDDPFPEASKLGTMHLNGVTSMLSHIRRKVYISGVPPFSIEQEVELCIVSMHAVKVFPMLSKTTRLRLAQSMLSCALVSTQDNFEEAFSQVEIENVRAELDMSWCLAVNSELSRPSQHSMDMLLTPPDTPETPH